MKKLLTLIIALLMATMLSCALAEERPTVYTSGDFRYVLHEDGTAKILSYTGKETDMNIPAELDGHSVTAIGAQFLDTNKGVTTVTLPDSVTSIEENAFTGTFSGLRLTDIYVSVDHPTLATIDGVLFEKSTKALLRFPCRNDATDYVIPQGIQIIGEKAFYRCTDLRSVTIPDSVTSIGNYAFRVCNALTSVTIPDSVTSIGEWAFSNCTSLISVTLPQNVTSIADSAFKACTSLTSITIPDGVTTIGDSAFLGCKSLTSITIPDSVTSIGMYAFEECSNDLTLIVPRDSYARQYCIDNGLPYTYPDANDWLLN